MPLHRSAFTAMTCPCELLLHGRTQAKGGATAQAVAHEVHRIEMKYSRYRDDSVTARINVAAHRGGSLEVDEETGDLIDRAFAAYGASDGLFDITAGLWRTLWTETRRVWPTPAETAAIAARVGLHRVIWRRPLLSFATAGMEVDFGGLGKEYAADRAAAICRDLGIESGLLDLGGDIVVLGPQPDGAPWRIGIRDPRDPQTAIATLFVPRGALATSGAYARFREIEGRRIGHIVDPRTGDPVAALASVSVAHDTCLAAGLACTIALLKGTAGETWLASSGLPYLVVDPAHQMRGSIVLRSDAV